MRDGSAWGAKRGQFGIAAAGRHAGDIDQILDRETEAGERPRRRTPAHVRAGPGTKAPVKVMTLSGLARCPQARRRTRPWYRNAAD